MNKTHPNIVNSKLGSKLLTSILLRKNLRNHYKIVEENAKGLLNSNNSPYQYLKGLLHDNPQLMDNIAVIQDRSITYRVKLILEKYSSELPDYELPQYIQLIDKIPYKNTKHDFKKLEEMGQEYVKKSISN